MSKAPSPRSTALFHYTDKLENLKSILKHGFFPSYSLESIPFGKYPDIAFPMVSFCDVPISRISQHIEFYGSYGLAMDKHNWAMGRKINPILYISNGSRLPNFLQAAFNGAIKLNNEHNDSECLENMRSLCAYIKCMSGKTKNNKDKDFYTENEWRYVPKNKKIKPYLKKEEFENREILQHHQKIANEAGCIKIHPNQIRYILVNDDFEVFELIEFIQNDLTYPDYRKKQLISKILPLEFILEDV